MKTLYTLLINPTGSSRCPIIAAFTLSIGTIRCFENLSSKSRRFERCGREYVGGGAEFVGRPRGSFGLILGIGIASQGYCNNFHCPHPQKLACNQFCISCSRTIGPHRTHEVKFEFVQVTKKELALQEHLPPRSKLNLTYGYLPGRLRSMPENCWPSSTRTWPRTPPKKNDCEPVLGYYRYTLVEHPGESSGSWGKLFWFMVFGAAVWFGFFR